MIQENKNLVLQDLCSRLSHGVKMNHIADNEVSPKTLIGIAKDMITLQGAGGYEFVDVEHYKPYLFPLSSMTEEQKEEFRNKFNVNIDISKIFNGIDFYGSISFKILSEIINWLNKNHFDYNRFIEKDLAIDATNLGIYENEIIKKG